MVQGKPYGQLVMTLMGRANTAVQMTIKGKKPLPPLDPYLKYLGTGGKCRKFHYGPVVRTSDPHYRLNCFPVPEAASFPVYAASVLLRSAPPPAGGITNTLRFHSGSTQLPSAEPAVEFELELAPHAGG